MKEEKTVYRMIYLKSTLHRGIEYYSLDKKTLTDLKDIDKYKIYYLTDNNGNVIIDNRKNEEWN